MLFKEDSFLPEVSSVMLRHKESRNAHWNIKIPDESQMYHKNSRPIFNYAVPAELISGKRSKLFYTS